MLFYGDIILWAMPTPLWSLLYSTIVLYDSEYTLFVFTCDISNTKIVNIEASVSCMEVCTLAQYQNTR